MSKLTGRAKLIKAKNITWLLYLQKLSKNNEISNLKKRGVSVTEDYFKFLATFESPPADVDPDLLEIASECKKSIVDVVYSVFNAISRHINELPIHIENCSKGKTEMVVKLQQILQICDLVCNSAIVAYLLPGP